MEKRRTARLKKWAAPEVPSPEFAAEIFGFWMKSSRVEAISEGIEVPAPRMWRICQDLRRVRTSLEQGRTADTRPPNHKTRQELISRAALIARASMQ